ncbi:MAG: PilZ domain-containing protein [Gammaproteobacteria bacterium]|nr:PilZ domain-containing protein [Gammaproteobacteria bacterium]
MKDTSDTDRRWNIRQALQLEVSVSRTDHETLRFTSRNISMGGMFLGNTPEKIDEGSNLTVAFSLQTRQGASHHHLPARVARKSNQGTAVVFSDYDMETVHILREVLYNGALEY